jgi:DNA-binding beta-propeller fold protein YncE
MMAAVGLAVGGLGLASPALAQLAVVAVDAKVEMVNGAATVLASPGADMLAVIDLAANPPKLVAEIEAPASVVGPPMSVVATPDGALALMTSNQRIDPNDKTKTVPDNRVSVIDLRSGKVVQTLEAGAGAAGLSVNPAGTLALVANRNAGTVTVMEIAGGKVSVAGTVTLGPATIGVSHVAFTPDGKSALVTRDGDFFVSVLKIDGSKVELAKRDMTAGIRPYGLVIAPHGRTAFTANIGRGAGDSDTVSIIDLSREPFRVVDTVTVGPTPEGLMISPDGNWLAVVIHDGGTKAANSPYKTATGKVVMLRVDGLKLTKAGEYPIGNWSQGAVFSNDGRTLAVQNMVEKNVQFFRVEDGKLTDTGHRIALKGGGAAIRTVGGP